MDNNKSIINKLMRNTLNANKVRNKYIIIAIVLTTLMLSFVFSTGLSYYKSMKIQQLRLMGTNAHVALTLPSEDQIGMIKQLPYVEEVGLQHNVGMLKLSDNMKFMSISLHWFDQEEWKNFRTPSYDDIKGEYPKSENEIMVPLWILNNMGIDNPKIGMKIPLSYYLGEERGVFQTKDFILSGYFTDYTYIRSGNIGSILVSKELAKQSGKSVSNSGAISIKYNDSKNIDKYNEMLKDDINLNEKQQIRIVPIYENESSNKLSTIISFLAVIFFLMFAGYLLIYNVFYISVSKDIQYYGLLKTVGTTSKQLKKIVVGQANILAAIGIPIGLLIGALLSLIIVPKALSLMNLETGMEISFHPFIFIGTAFFSYITIILGVRKSAKITSKISPIEAMNYTGVKVNKKQISNSRTGNLSKMAFRSIFRDPKRASIVFLSLFLGLTIFLIISTMISSMDIKHYINSYVKNDFILSNNTLEPGAMVNGSSEKQKFDSSFISTLESDIDITNLRTTSIEKMSMKYDPTIFKKHMDWFYDRFNLDEDLSYQTVSDNFWGYIIAIDERYIEEFNQSHPDSIIDLKAFKKGDIALFGSNNPTLYSDVKEVDISILSNNIERKFTIGGFLPFGFQFAAGAMAPNIYVSQEVLNSLVDNPYIYKINMDVKAGESEKALNTIKKMTENDNDISRISRIERQAEMRDSKLMLYILGGGVAFILALIGILNFINVMASEIISRKKEFAMLESIGMTYKQVKNMLVLEGFGYGFLTIFLVGIFGNIITYSIFILFKKQADYAIYTFPTIQMIVSIVIVLLVCLLTPIIIYKSLVKDSIVERLRDN
ncbi:MAG: ABC transporter permease [Pleomorphochaeta sp.]